MNIFIFILGLIIGGIIIWLVLRSRKGKNGKEKKGLIERQAEEKNENKKKILEYLQSRERISNDEIEKLLGVSDATATRYLDELEKEGLIRQVGETGRSVYYEKI